MGLLEIAILGIGLAMDAVAVSMTNGMVYKNLGVRQYIAMPLFFGVFQGAMPLIGFYAGNIFAEIITKYGGMVIFIILGFIGGKMLMDGIKQKKESNTYKKQLTIGVLIFQAIATSIDAFAVGVGFCAVRVDIIPAIVIIAAITAILVIVAMIIGKKFGDLLENKAEIFGGIILILIGIKALI